MFNAKFLVPAIVSVATLANCSQADAQESRFEGPATYRVVVEFFDVWTYETHWETVYETSHYESAYYISVECLGVAASNPYDSVSMPHSHRTLSRLLGQDIFDWYWETGTWPIDVRITVQYGDERPMFLHYYGIEPREVPTTVQNGEARQSYSLRK